MSLFKYNVQFTRDGNKQVVTIRQKDIGAAADVFRRSAKKVGLEYGRLTASDQYSGTIAGPEGGATISLAGKA